MLPCGVGGIPPGERKKEIKNVPTAIQPVHTALLKVSQQVGPRDAQLKLLLTLT